MALPHDCLNVIASFCCSKTLTNLAFSNCYFHQLIKSIDFWINKCTHVKIQMFINESPLESAKALSYIKSINVVYWTNLYQKAINAHKDAYNTLTIQKAELYLNTQIKIEFPTYTALPTTIGCYDNKPIANWVNKIIIQCQSVISLYTKGFRMFEYKVILWYRGDTRSVIQNEEQVLYLLSYCYSKGAIISDLEDYSFVKNHRSLRRTVWQTADILGHIQH